MQRRAAAIYFVFFLVIGSGMYGYITVVDAQRPQISIEGEAYGANDTFQKGGQSYTVSTISEEEASGEGGTVITGEITWTNESAVSTATLANGTNATYQDQTWQVVIENSSGVSAFTLRGYINVTDVLVEDPDVEDQPATQGGQKYVVWADNGTLGPTLAEYLPEPETTTISEGDTFPYEGNDATVSDVSPSEVTLSWTAPTDNTIELEEGANVTLGGETHLVHFKSASEVQLTRNFQAYKSDLDRIDYFEERKKGLWGVTLLSFMTAIVLLGAAYMPIKD
jgi:hypothetical protein